MKEFINKLIEKLEGLKTYYAEDFSQGYSCEVDCVEKYEVKKIVNELTEEYINTSADTSTNSLDASTNTSTTNADRIRSMTDEELVEFLYDTNHYFENNEYLVRFGSEIVQDEEINILDWLKSEVEGDADELS